MKRSSLSQPLQKWRTRKPLPAESPENAEHTLEELRAEAKTSSDRNRNYFFIYLGVMLYVLLVVVSTTDLQLLVPTLGIKLPLVDFNLPLFGFYLAAPLVILAVHFNFLQNLDSHHYKLMLWHRKCGPGGVPRHEVPAFLFDYAVLEREGFWPGGLRLINAALCLYLGPFTLAMLLFRFSDYQSAEMTLWHLTCFVLSLWVVKRVRIQFKKHEAHRERETKLWRNTWRKSVAAVGLSGLIVAVAALTLFVSLASTEALMNWYPSEWDGSGASDGVTKTDENTSLQMDENDEIRALTFSASLYAIKTMRTLRKSLWDYISPRITIDPNKPIYVPTESELRILAALDGQSDWVNWYKEVGWGLDLRGRSLRNADFAGVSLPRAIFIGAHLEGILMIEANMLGADFRSARLQGANLNYANLRGANLVSAQLAGASLFSADLQGTYSQFAQFQGATLEQANASGSDLSVAQLQGANLSGAELRGVRLFEARLLGANLNSADLQGANLVWSQLQGATLSNTKFAGTWFSSTLMPSSIGYRGSFTGISDEENVLVVEEPMLRTTTEDSPPEDLYSLVLEIPIEQPNWLQLKEIAQQIPVVKRKIYLERIEIAEKDSVTLQTQGNAKWTSQLHDTQASHMAEQLAHSLCILVEPEPANIAVYRQILSFIDINFNAATAGVFVHNFGGQLCTLQECAEKRIELSKKRELKCKNSD